MRSKVVLLPATPEPLEIDWRSTAFIIIDVQNAFVSGGGLFDLAGIDIVSRARTIIEHIKKIARIVRSKGGKVIYTVEEYSPAYQEAGGPDSVLWHKHLGAIMCRQHHEWKDRLTVRGTWGAQIVEELKPEENDIVCQKLKYSAFFETPLSTFLKTHNIRYLLFVGVTTNICVEASIRDAFYLGYFPILVSDAVVNSGPPATQEATIFNVITCYGWVTSTVDILKATRC